MSWTNTQATTLDGLAVSYTNTTQDYGSGSTSTFEVGSALEIAGGSFTADGSTVTIEAASTLVVDSTSDIVVNGVSLLDTVAALPRGIVARNRATSDAPAAGTTGGTPAEAGTVITCTLAQAIRGRIYRISAPALSVRMNVAGRTTGVQLTYTENGGAPTATSTSLASLTVDCPDAGVPEPCPIGATYVRSGVTGPLKVLLSVWVIGAGVATTASGGDHGGDPNGVIELLIEDVGIDPGATP